MHGNTYANIVYKVCVPAAWYDVGTTVYVCMQSGMYTMILQSKITIYIM